MNKLKFFFLILALSIPTISITYKNSLEDLVLIPSELSDNWKLQITYSTLSHDHEINEVPLLSSFYNQHVISEQILGIKEVSNSKTMADRTLVLNKEHNDKLSIIYDIFLKSSGQGEIMRDLIPKENLQEVRSHYLKLSRLSSRVQNSLQELQKKFLSHTENKEEITRRIYFYITEEIPTQENIKNLSKALSLEAGSSLVKAKIMVYLARLNDIPARINLIYNIEEKDNKYILKRNYLPEVLLDNYWYPMSVNAHTFVRVPNDHIIISRDLEANPWLLQNDRIKISISPIFTNNISSRNYQQKLKEAHPILGKISLHNLPINMQTAFFTILLIPFATLVLSFFRNVIGIVSFGIFTPILLSLFFIETSITSGIIFFSFIVLLGFFQRYILDKFYLLAVPRLSILLTLVIISYTVFSMIAYDSTSFFEGGAPMNYLPIVIITSFIERFSVNFIEDGPRTTLKTLFGTILISFFCYFIFESMTFKLLVFNNPELLLIPIGLNILIGNYKGYRITEFLRFKEFKENV